MSKYRIESLLGWTRVERFTSTTRNPGPIDSKDEGGYRLYRTIGIISILSFGYTSANSTYACNVLLQFDIIDSFQQLEIVIVIVNPIFLQPPRKRSRGNQLILRLVSKTKSIGSGSDPESQAGRQAGRQSNGYGGWCLELRRWGR